MIIIPDISFYQDDDNTPQGVNFYTMRAAGASGVIIRAGQNTWIDEDFATNYRNAKAAGLPRGVYFFYDSRTPPQAQAVLCMSQIGTDKPELGVWLDLEENYNGPYKGWLNWKKCLDKLLEYTPFVGIYTGPYYWMSNHPTGAADLDYFRQFPLWIAHYNTSPMIPSPWVTWMFWQYTSSGDGFTYGVESREIDLNHFNGDEQQFRNSFATQPHTGETMSWYLVNTAALNIRSGPGSSYADIGDLLKGEKIEAASVVGGWYKIVNVWHMDGTVQAVTGDAWCSGAYLVATTAPVVTPPPASEPANIPDYIMAHFSDGTTKKYIPE